MTWVKIDDQMPDHPKFVKLGAFGLPAFAIQIRAMCYCARYLTDGELPAGVTPLVTAGLTEWEIETAGIPGIMGVGTSGADFDWPTIMVDAGLWEKTEDGFLVHDYLAYNPSRDKVLQDREAAAQRKQRSRHGVTTPVTTPVTTTVSPASPYPSRTRPLKEDITTTTRKKRTKEPVGYTTEFEEFWVAYPSRAPGSNPKRLAADRFATLVSSGEATPETLIAQAKAYALFCDTTMRKKKWIMQAATFLGEKEGWSTPYVPTWKWLEEVDDEVKRDLVGENLGRILNV